MSARSLLALLAASALPSVQSLAIRQSETPVWLTLPPTPALPAPITEVKTPVDGVELWMQQYNEEAGSTPIVMIHGGLGYSAYFGAVISRLIEGGHYVIAVDRRGHGRSTFNSADVFTFDMFAQDTFQLLSQKGISKYNIVGWSDGAATTLAALLNSTIEAHIERAFVFGGFSVPEDTNATFTDTAIYSEFVSRCQTEYSTLQPTANFTEFATKVGTLEATLPQWTDADLAEINGSKVTIAGAEYEEAVNRDVAPRLNKAIIGSNLVILKNVSHFAPLQDPDQFTKAVEDFLLV
ncbi:putative esterase [Cryphonectria parasitica EP155]|uniref:Esterase n=1 Tax=Cryphonectria parasitica (strain ATCC 38755 / EP155) TaxID=660469 RepID=A0A9P4XYR8_CRYP1|nr:putative esterase [Cryphonectria parasitica EP155]KAF3763373.1 putative esterase [Cryphonectria parasitica EP155]